MKTATEIASIISSIPRHSARVWEAPRTGEIRVYVTGPYSGKGDGGYLVVGAESADASKLRHGVLVALVEAGQIKEAALKDVGTIQF